MRMKNLVTCFLTTLAVLAVGGCATKRDAELVTMPGVGEVSTRGVGEQLVTQGFRITVPGLIIKKTQPLGAFQIRAGTYPLRNLDKAGQVFDDAASSAGGSENVLLRDSDQQLCVEKVCANLDFSTGPVHITTRKSPFEQTILYSGKVGNKVTVSYREFINDTARAAFTNEASYDLNESKVIGYKGARLEVLNATNTEITYKVLSGFD